MEWEGFVLLGIALALVVTAPVVARRIREMRLSRAGLDQVDKLTDDAMILHMARLFGAMGYKVWRPHEDGAEFDLVLTDGLDQRRGVLVRQWRKLVDEPIVRAAAEAAARRELVAPMIVSVEGYTFKAREAGSRAEVILWSLPELTEAIGRVRQQAVAFPDLPRINPVVGNEAAATREPVRQEPQPPQVAPRHRRRPERLRAGDKWGNGEAPRCPRCKRPMVVRKSSDDEYWGCSQFPRCLGSRPK